MTNARLYRAALSFVTVAVALAACTSTPIAQTATGHKPDQMNSVPADLGLHQSPLINGRWKAAGGEVLDTTSGLIWRRCSVGMRWDESGRCSGEKDLLSFDDALEIIEGRWRAPTKEELASLIDDGKKQAEQSPAIDVDVFPDMQEGALWYWTRTRNDLNPSFGIVVAFGTGFINPNAYRNNKFAVRMVRQPSYTSQR